MIQEDDLLEACAHKKYKMQNKITGFWHSKSVCDSKGANGLDQDVHLVYQPKEISLVNRHPKM